MNRNQEYFDFVESITSEFSAKNDKLAEVIANADFEFSRLFTGAVGLTSESGELLDIVKKLAFQGKQFTPETREHLIKELSDVFWYITQVCLALDITYEDVLQVNVDKLTARYPDKFFNVIHSENRKSEDI